MKQSKRFIFFTFLLLSNSSIIMPVVDETLKSPIDKASPMGLYQVLEGAKIVAFSKDFLIKGGLDQKDLTGWNDVTDAANELVKAAVDQGAAPDRYKDNLDVIKNAADFFKTRVHILHEQYGKLGFKKVKDTVVVSLGDTTFSSEAIAELKDTLATSATYQKNMSEILKDILKSTVVAKSWAEKYYTKSGDLKDAKSVMRNYADVIKSYDKIKQNKQPFAQFLNDQKIKDQKAAEKFVDALQGVEYIMQAKLLYEEKADRRKNLAAVQEIIEQTRTLYPGFLSVQEIAKLGDADKISTIIFAQAGTYEAVLGQLNREVGAILFAAQNKKK